MRQAVFVGAEIGTLEIVGRNGAVAYRRRLARENGWSPAFTARVITEYERFLLLASTSETIVCPSDEVDQAWHLHLLHTRDYRRFCRKRLGRRLDHTPSSGGPAERTKFAVAYTRTLEQYRQRFGEEPPADIWPPLERRFDEEREHVRVDVNGHWVIARPLFLRRAAARVASLTALRPQALAAFGALATLGCASSGEEAWLVSGPTFLGLYLTAWAASLAAASYAKRQAPLDRGAPQPELDAYEAAYLAGQGVAAVDAAIAVLVASGAVAFDAPAGTLRAQSPLAPGAHPLEAAVHARLAHDAPVPLASLRSDAAELTAGIAGRLTQLRLIGEASYGLPFVLALSVPLVGLGRIISRIGTPHPVGLLVVLAVLGLVIAFTAFGPSFRLPAGEKALRELRQRYEAVRGSAAATGDVTGGTFAFAVGLFGFAALAPSAELDGLKEWMRTPESEGGGGGCGGDDGGGDGGGGGCSGCGGCGGCGG